MRRLFVWLACLAVVASCAPPSAPSAVAGEPWKTETELVTPVFADPDTIDPQLASFTSEAAAVGMLYEPLLTWDPASLALVPAAARDLPRVSDDGRTYTYTLRAGLQYSDETPLTARRFVDAFTRLCDPMVAAEYAFVAYPIAGCERWNVMDTKRASAEELLEARAALGVRAVNDLTIEFRLAAPFAAFPQTTALWVGAPVRVEDIGRTMSGYPFTSLVRYVGNGPFVLAEWTKGERMVFERNERYRLPVRLARWTKRVVADADTARVLYDAGRIDAVAVAPRDPADRDALLARPDLMRLLGDCTSYVGFNVDLPPLDDANVRLALAKSLDREDYVRSITRTGRAAASLVTHGLPGHAHDDRVQSFDLAEARRLLAASKYGMPADGKIGGVSLVFPIRDSDADRRFAAWVAQQWYANLGLTVTPQIQSGWGSLVKRPEQRPQLYRLGWCVDYPDGQDWYAVVFHSSSAVTRTGFKDPLFDAVVRTADRSADPLERETLYERASLMLSRAAPGAWLSWTETWWLVRPELQGYQQSSFDWDFAQFSLARIVGVKR